MVHLPNEIWLQIIERCDDHKALWMSLRRVNAQLKACVEQHFADEILPSITVALPMTLPTYDARNPIRGEALFRHSGTARQDRTTFDLSETGPEFHLSHFLGRWAGMKDVDGGWLRESVEWNIALDGKTIGRRLRAGRAVRDGVGEDEARIEFDWKTTLTGFYT